MICKPQKIKLKSYFEVIEFTEAENKDNIKKQKKIKKANKEKYKNLLK
jgi:hypothetical protein